jgi:hypothetical protein
MPYFNRRSKPKKMEIMLRYGRLVALISILASPAQAQITGFGKSSAPISGGTGQSSGPANPFPSMNGTYAGNHKTPDGRLCISIHPTTKPQAINPKIIDQSVIVENMCGQSIRVQVCYAGSSDCIIVPLTGYQRLQRTLGVASGSTSFRYEYRELF